MKIFPQGNFLVASMPVVCVRPPTQQQSPPLTTSVLPNDRVVPSSLFLTDDDTPVDPPTTFPIDSDPDLPDSIVDDSLGVTDDSVHLEKDPDDLFSTDDTSVDRTGLSIPRDPMSPCSVTFGPVHDLHWTHHGTSSLSFEHLVQRLCTTHLATKTARLLTVPSSEIHCQMQTHSSMGHDLRHTSGSSGL